MNSQLTKKERKAINADLKAAYMYIAIPFLLLIGVKGYEGNWYDILIAPDWSLASCLIFGQLSAKISKTVAMSTAQTNEYQFGWYTSKRFLLVVIALMFYTGMLSQPTIYLGVAQIMLFLLASGLHFKDGITNHLLIMNAQQHKSQQSQS